ncbi:hypothetical protein ACFY1C_35705 [Streptomyces sp. NPDC001279]
MLRAAVRLSDEISATLDRTTKRPNLDEPPPRIVVDTVYLDANPTQTDGN